MFLVHQAAGNNMQHHQHNLSFFAKHQYVVKSTFRVLCFGIYWPAPHFVVPEPGLSGRFGSGRKGSLFKSDRFPVVTLPTICPWPYPSVARVWMQPKNLQNIVVKLEIVQDWMFGKKYVICKTYWC